MFFSFEEVRGSYSPINTCKNSLFIACSFYFQHPIICFSSDFLRILQKDLFFMMENSPILAVVVPCYKEEAVLHETHKRLSQLFDQMIQAGQISPESSHIICKWRKYRPDLDHHQRATRKQRIRLRAEPRRKRRPPECPACRTQCRKRPLRDSHFHWCRLARRHPGDSGHDKQLWSGQWHRLWRT